MRWDLSTGYSMRLAYEKHWYDLDNASPDFDQFKLGFVDALLSATAVQ